MEKSIFIKELIKMGFIFIGSKYDEKYKFNNYIIEIELGSEFNRHPKLEFYYKLQYRPIYKCTAAIYNYKEALIYIENELSGKNAIVN